MCGIGGIINPKGFELKQIKAMTDVIRHRGPNDEGFMAYTGTKQPLVSLGGTDTPAGAYTSSFPYRPAKSINEVDRSIAKLALGHRRLSILDLSPAGHQPMSYDNGRYWIVLNGEIYNYLEIREELITSGYRFLSNSDTEVVLAAWKQWGPDCQARFIGMWSFVIFDSEKEQIFMSRDRFGIKPLYYWFAPDNTFCFASEIKQFTVLPGWAARMNPQRVYDYLVFAYTDHTDETMFAGVNQIPGGYCYSADIKHIKADHNGKIAIQKWYSPDEKQFTGRFDEAAAKFEALFKSAVDIHLRADVPIGSALSGGLDSSAIVCEVNNILREQGVEHLQKTFSSCSSDERYDEKKWIDVVVDFTRVEAHFVYPKLEDVFKLTPELIWYHDEPYQSQSAFLGYHVFELAKQNEVKVLLNGQGADEYLGGYGHFTSPRLSKKFRKLKWKALTDELGTKGYFGGYPYPFAIKTIISSLFNGPVRTFFDNHFGPQKAIKNIINWSLLGAKDIHPNENIPANIKTVHGVSAHTTFYSTLPKYLKWEDRNSMAHSIEARVPFLDHRLVEFAYNLPDDYLDFKGETKRVLRQGLKNILPEKIKNRKDKKGFITPEERWVKEDNPNLFRGKVQEAIELTKGIIKPEAIQYFDQIVSGDIPFNYTYWRLILFAAWVERFQVKLNNDLR